MAFKKALAHRFCNIYRVATAASPTTCRLSSAAFPHRKPDKIAPDPGDGRVFRRYIHRLGGGSQSLPPELRSFPTGESLIEKLRAMDISRHRIRLDGIIPPPEMAPEVKPAPASPPETEGLTVSDMKKLLKLSQLEVVKEKLRGIEASSISREEFIGICSDGCWTKEEARQFAAALDESGTVVVLGNVVLLRPEQVVKAIQGMMPVQSPNPNDPRLKEFRAMQELKAMIDDKANSLVRRELWCGLGYFVVQTAAFMRLTFWELSWDVMEPICFYVTSIYCMAGYAFFLRTSIEPSFEGFFQSRFAAKQSRLMKEHGFDLRRFNELRLAFDPLAHQASATVPKAMSLPKQRDSDSKKSEFAIA